MANELAISRVYDLAVGETRFRAEVHIREDEVEIPMAAELPDGGWLSGVVTVDRESFDRAEAMARERGINHVAIGALISHALGRPGLVSIQRRALLPR